jgi:asparagine synthase (glutamine-hydrolysing)
MPGLRDKVALRRLASRTLPAEIWNRPKQPYRAPMATALFGPQAPDYVRDLLSDAAVARFGLLDPKATRVLAARAFDRQGRMAGEREEMALVGALTLQGLAQAYLADFGSRADAARRRLDGVAPTVRVDRVADASSSSDSASSSSSSSSDPSSGRSLAAPATPGTPGATTPAPMGGHR